MPSPRLCVFIASLVFASILSAQTATLNLASGSGAPGALVTLNVNLSGGANPAGVQWEMTYPSSAVVYESSAVGSSASTKSISCNGVAGVTTCVVFGFNTDTMPNGVAATVSFRILAGTTATSAAIQMGSLSATTAGGVSLNINGNGSTITINQPVVNRAPTATSASTSTNEDTSKAIVLAGTDPDGDSLSFTVLTQPAHGSLSGSAPNLTYSPAANYNGPDSFTFRVSDGKGGTGNGTISITVNPVNDAPTTQNQSVSTPQNTAKSITLTGSDVDGDSLTFTTGSPSHGSVTGSGATRTYTPTNGYSGADAFTFQVSDGKGGTANGTVNITVTAAANGAPTAGDASTSTNEDAPKAITLTGTDPDSDPLTYTVLTSPAHGSLSGAAPNLTYIPAANYNGPDSFTFRVADGKGGQDNGTISITVNPVNDAPTTQNQSVTTAQDTAKSITLTGNDVDGDSLTFSTGSPSHGSLSGSGATRTYTPTNGYTGPDSFTFQVSDNKGGTANGTVSITVTAGANAPPTANNVSMTTNEDTPKAITLTGSDPNSDPLTFAVMSQPAHGSVSGNAPNVMYAPAANYNGPDSFTFRVADNKGGQNNGTVSITVMPVNDPPTTQNQSVSTPANTPKSITLTASDVDGDSLTFSTASPSHGSLSGSGANRTYTPTNGYTGSDSFSFSVSDNKGGAANGTVSITVTAGQNGNPTANDVSVTINEDTPRAITLTGSDPNSDPLTFTILSQPAHGSLAGAPPSVTYTPAGNYSGTDTFTFRVSDGKGGTDDGTVKIFITAVNDAPTAQNLSMTTALNTAKAITLVGNDAEGDKLTFAIVTPPAHGTLTGSGASRTYTPANGYSGPDSFTYSVSDNKGGSNTATVSITVGSGTSNKPPTATDANVTTQEDTQKVITLTGSDPDSDPLTFAVLTQPQHGTLSGAAPNLTYKPAGNYNGTDSFTFRVSDNKGGSDTGAIGILITAVNDAPIAQEQTVSTPKDKAKAITLLASDPDGDKLNYSVISGPSHGALTGTAPSLLYTPAKGFSGSDSFTFRVNDDKGVTATAIVKINVGGGRNDPPKANSSSVTVNEDTPKTVTLSATDPNSDALTYTVLTQPTKGTLSGTFRSTSTSAPAAGPLELIYTPKANYNGPDSFTFRVSDGNGGTDVGTVSIKVNAVNDSPKADDQSITIAKNAPRSITLTAKDPDGDTLAFSITRAPGKGTLSGTAPNVTYTPNNGYSGNDSFAFRVTDNNGGSDIGTVNINVSGGSDALSLSSLNCSNGQLVVGGDMTCLASLSGPAPAGGVTVNLTGGTSQLTVPASVKVAANDNSAPFTVSSALIETAETAKLGASYNGSNASTNLVLVPLQPKALSCTPVQVAAGETLTCQVTLNSSSFKKAVSLAVASSTGDVQVPATVPVSAGHSTANFQAPTKSSSKQQSATVTVNMNGAKATSTVSIVVGNEPIITLESPQVIAFNNLLSITVVVRDPKDLPVNVTAANLPNGAKFDADKRQFSWTPTKSQIGSHEVTFRARNSANNSSEKTITIQVTDGKLQLTRLSNTASPDEASCSTGALATLFGLGFTGGSTDTAKTTPLPTSLNGISVKMNGVAARLLSVGPKEVSLQCPSLKAGAALSITVEKAGPPKETATLNVPGMSVKPADPAIFSLDGTGHGQGMVFNARTGKLAMLANPTFGAQPAEAGDYLMMYANGLGPVDQDVEDGAPGPSSPPARVTGTVRVKVGGIFVPTLFAGLSPGLVGTYQVNIRLSSAVPAGDEVPVTIELQLEDGTLLQSNTVTIAVADQQ